jgi:hypothetical protein
MVAKSIGIVCTSFTVLRVPFDEAGKLSIHATATGRTALGMIEVPIPTAMQPSRFLALRRNTLGTAPTPKERLVKAFVFQQEDVATRRVGGRS